MINTHKLLALCRARPIKFDRVNVKIIQTNVMKNDNVEENEVKAPSEEEVNNKANGDDPVAGDNDKADTTDTVEEAEGEEHEELTGEKDPLEALQDELAESKDKYLRLYSEFENFRRRTAKEKLDMVQTANADLITSLLPIMDDFERAEKSFTGDDADVKALKEGLDLVFSKFRKALEQKGLKVMEHKQGTDFDPEFHDAITQIPAPKEKLKGKVVDVVEKGYLLKDKVIRYAKVVIGS